MPSAPETEAPLAGTVNQSEQSMFIRLLDSFRLWQRVVVLEIFSMPKRSFPFHDSSPLQMKTHVGILHVEKEKQLNKIYARTQEMLFQGASKGFRQTQNGVQDPSTLKTLYKCHGCLQTRNAISFSCSFCEKRLCNSCCQQCILCAGNFCGLCSTTNYDEREERCFCLGCATQ